MGMVVKTSAPGNGLKIAMGSAREALFYQEFATELRDAGVPKCYHAEADMATGEMLVLIECAEDAAPAGTFFGPENPNNWAVKDELKAMCEGNPSAEQISADAFALYAKLHTKYWQDTHLFSKEWLKGSNWQQGEGETAWKAPQQMAAGAWAALNKAREEGTSAIKWDPHLVACVDSSFAKADWGRFQSELKGRP